MSEEEPPRFFSKTTILVIKLWLSIIYLIALYVASAAFKEDWTPFEYGRF